MTSSPAKLSQIESYLNLSPQREQQQSATDLLIEKGSLTLMKQGNDIQSTDKDEYVAADKIINISNNANPYHNQDNGGSNYSSKTKT